ncbi:hypothetical protein IEQ34_003070 [Dendrobium chrysotoxum]|uniref:Secreted protein n=1 Tax=Dendrobium chrysotoxum TaxID=161865 RepID=A0AAV7HI92_DENCH|nr:hypothetical protein IEQ34_003070 [Dendrobium chrysotoxum]
MVQVTDILLDLLQLRTEPAKCLNDSVVAGPLCTRPFTQIELIARVVRQNLDQRYANDRLHLVCYGLQKRLLRVFLQFLVFGRAGLGHEPAAGGGAVREVAGVRVLAEVDGGVHGGCDPDDGGAGLDEIFQGVQTGPPRLVFEVSMSDFPNLLPPGLEFTVLLNG